MKILPQKRRSKKINMCHRRTLWLLQKNTTRHELFKESFRNACRWFTTHQARSTTQTKPTRVRQMVQSQAFVCSSRAEDCTEYSFGALLNYTTTKAIMCLSYTDQLGFEVFRFSTLFQVLAFKVPCKNTVPTGLVKIATLYGSIEVFMISQLPRWTRRKSNLIAWSHHS